MKILIGADICVTDSNKALFETSDIQELIGTELRARLDEADVRIFNLEGPLTDKSTPINKCGPNLRMPEASIRGIRLLRPTVLGLANNHIMDHGEQGYQSTVRLLNAGNIPFVGCGDDLLNASKPYIIEKGKRKIGVYACAEHEFTIVSQNAPGANPYDPLETFDHIQNLKQQCDYLIVLFHGGKEYYRYPSPDIQRIFRKMAQKGADLVIAQHTHCIGCFEEYEGSTLIYGQGNFIFDNNSDEYWDSGLLVQVNLQNETSKVEFIPFVKKQGGVIRMPDANQSARLMDGFYVRSKQVQDRAFVQKKYREFALSQIETYLRFVHGNNFWFKVANKLMGGKLVFKMYQGKGALVALLNMIECEAHHELLITAIKALYKRQS